MMGPSWMDTVKAEGVLAAAMRLGLRYIPNPRPGSLFPCPACGAEKRGSDDKRGPVGLRRDHRGWVCHRCKVSGDALTLAALVITGTAKPDKHRWEEVRSRLLGDVPLKQYKAPLLPPHEAPKRPSQEEVISLWKRDGAVCEDPMLAEVLSKRGINTKAVTERELCRVVPAKALPLWASFQRKSWHQSGHRALFPLFDHLGELQSLHARRMEPGALKPKGLSPVGYEVSGLVLADDSARALLRGEGDWLGYLLIVEGAPDFLCASLYFGEEANTAVIGILSGSWTDAFAKQLPKHISVLIATHFDDAGEKYAQKIRATLAAGTHITRWRPSHAATTP